MNKENCSTCKHFVYQAIISKHLARQVGKTNSFAGTPIETSLPSSFPLCGCLYAARTWERKTPAIRKPRGIDCLWEKK